MYVYFYLSSIVAKGVSLNVLIELIYSTHTQTQISAQYNNYTHLNLEGRGEYSKPSLLFSPFVSN